MRDGVAIAVTRWPSNGEAKIAKLTDTDDIEAHLTTFEHMMAAYEVPRSRWVCKIAPQLTGKAQLVFAAMDVTVVAHYDKVKATILRRYVISVTRHTDSAFKRRLGRRTRRTDSWWCE